MTINNEASASIDDEVLVTKISQGDRTALGELYDRYSQRLLSIASAILHNQRDAEDLLHDVFVEIWRTAENYDAARAPVSYWLLMRTRSRAIDRVRSLRIKDRCYAHIEREELTQDVSEEINLELFDAIDRLVTLPTKQREVLVMNHVHGYTCQEISDLTQTPLGTVKARLQGAAKRLRLQVAEEECA